MKIYKIKRVSNTNIYDNVEVTDVALRDIVYGLAQSRFMHTVYFEDGREFVVVGTIVELERRLKEL